MFKTKLPLAYDRKKVSNEKGISEKNGDIIFGQGWDKVKAADFLKGIDKSTRKISVELTEDTLKFYRATEADRQEISLRIKDPKKYNLKKWGIYEAIVADTLVDIHRERFTKAVLDALIVQARKGITILSEHDDKWRIGSTFDARTEAIPDNPENFQFVVKFYVPDYKTMQDGANAIDDLNTGVAKFISIHIFNRKATFIEAGDDFFLQFELDENNPPVLIEISSVTRGAQLRAEIKSLQNEKNPIFTEIKSKNPMKGLKITGGEIDGNRKSFEIEAKGEDGKEEIQAEGLQDHVNDLIKKAERTDAAEEKAKGLMKPHVDGIQNLQKSLDQPEDAEEILYAMESEDLIKKHDALKSLSAKVNPKEQIPGEGDLEDKVPDNYEY